MHNRMKKYTILSCLPCMCGFGLLNFKTKHARSYHIPMKMKVTNCNPRSFNICRGHCPLDIYVRSKSVI